MTMFSYKIYLGKRDRDGYDVQDTAYTDVLTKYFSAWTEYNAIGRWEGMYEPTVVMEIMTNRYDPHAMAGIVLELKKAGNQDYVMWIHVLNEEVRMK